MLKIYKRKQVWEINGVIVWSHLDYALLCENEVGEEEKPIEYNLADFCFMFPGPVRWKNTKKGLKAWFYDYGTLREWKHVSKLSKETILWEAEDAKLSTLKNLPTDRVLQYLKEHRISLSFGEM